MGKMAFTLFSCLRKDGRMDRVVTVKEQTRCATADRTIAGSLQVQGVQSIKQ
jgi:hypothetical protein